MRDPAPCVGFLFHCYSDPLPAGQQFVEHTIGAPGERGRNVVGVYDRQLAREKLGNERRFASAVWPRHNPDLRSGIADIGGHV